MTPDAAFIAYNTPVDVSVFEKKAKRIFKKVVFWEASVNKNAGKAQNFSPYKKM